MKLEFDVKIKDGRCFVNDIAYDVNGENALRELGLILNNHLHNRSSRLNGTYNKAVYWPAEVEAFVEWTLRKKYIIEPTQHAEQRIAENRFPPRCYMAALYGEVVQAELIDGVVYSVITRIPNRFENGEDICAVIRFTKDNQGYSNIAQVVTVWGNASDDHHETLNAANYVRPPILGCVR